MVRTFRKARGLPFLSPRTADCYVYELAAFFEALKSSLDFLATASSAFIKGMDTDSIRSFIKCADKGTRSGGLFDVTKGHLTWLKDLREYRHHLVHRMVITATAGYEMHRQGNLTQAVIRPIVVPSSTPRYVPDTRRSRMMGEQDSHLDCSTSEATVQCPDGTKKTVQFSVQYTPSDGFVEISEFMVAHRQRFEAFFCEIISELKELKFKEYV